MKPKSKKLKPFIVLAVVFSGTKRPQTELPEIQGELYQDCRTLRDRTIRIEEGHKSGTDVYESKVSVTAKDATDNAVAADGTINATAMKTEVILKSFEYSDQISHKTLLDTRFERSMQAGAFKLVSSEFDNKVLQQITPAIGESVEYMLWNGATTATKAAIAALVPGAGQGSVSASAQALIAAMPVTKVDSFAATIIYNYSQNKVVPGAGIGDYVKVAGTTVTSANIAAEYGKIFAAAPSKVTDVSDDTRARFFAPLGDRQLIKLANNAVGAADNKNFLVEGSGANEKISYNGHEIEFHPLAGFRVFTLPMFLLVLMDLASDMSTLETGPVSNGAQKQWYKNIQTMTTWVTNQKYITLYGG